jgi:hypothetical protein
VIFFTNYQTKWIKANWVLILEFMFEILYLIRCKYFLYFFSFYKISTYISFYNPSNSSSYKLHYVIPFNGFIIHVSHIIPIPMNSPKHVHEWARNTSRENMWSNFGENWFLCKSELNMLCYFPSLVVCPTFLNPYQHGTFTYQHWNILWITLLSWYINWIGYISKN